MKGFQGLIEACQIFSKYSDSKTPTHCEHDVLYITCVRPDDVSEEDMERLEELGFLPDREDLDCFMSFWYGSS